MSRSETKRLRVDAQRNRDRILRAAQEAFAVDGPDVPLDEIARRAEVGPGTVHRHFPTKESLFEAVVLDQLRARTQALRDLRQAPDPAAALTEFFVRMLESGTNRALRDGLGRAGVQLTSDEAVRVSTEFYQELDGLVRRGQQAGTIRQDLTAKQVKALLLGVMTASDWLGGDLEEQRQLATVVCAGFRAAGAD